MIGGRQVTLQNLYIFQKVTVIFKVTVTFFKQNLQLENFEFETDFVPKDLQQKMLTHPYINLRMCMREEHYKILLQARTYTCMHTHTCTYSFS